VSRWKGWLTVLAGAAVIGAAVSAHAAEPATPARTELTEITVLHGSRSGYLPVHISALTRLSFEMRPERNPTVHIEGGGPGNGVVVRTDVAIAHPPKQPARDPGVGAFLFRPGPQVFCHDACPKPRDVLFPFALGGVSPVADGVALPPGDYRLYLIAGNPDARVTLRLANLPPGTQELIPTHDIRAELAAAPRLDPFRMQSEHASFGRDVKPQSEALVFDAMGVYGLQSDISQTETCIYEGGAPGTPLDYEHQCPGGASAGFTSVYLNLDRPVDRGLFVPYAWIPVVPPGTYGMGDVYTSAIPIESAGVVNGWFEYGPPPTAATTAVPSELRLLSRRVTVRSGHVGLRLRCDGAQACRARLRVIPGGRAVTVSVPAGRAASVRLRLPGAVGAALRRQRARTIRVEVRDADGSVRVVRVKAA
jgi:hypothetical protein